VGRRSLERATAFAKEGKAQEAFDAASEAIEHAPSLVAAWVARGIYRTHLEDEPEGPLADFDQAVELTPDDLNARFQRGEYLSSLGELERAYEDFDAAIRIAPKIGQLYFRRASTRMRLDEQPEGWGEACLPDFDMAEKLGFHDDGGIFIERALVYHWTGDSETALAMLDEAAKAFPEAGDIPLIRATMEREAKEAAK
jgi:tetratricopeptide (TPR) repeat protein